MSFFISNAVAASAGQAAGGDSTFSLVMIVAMFALAYFMLIRPQNRRAKEHREMLSKLQKGDEIITSGGILAKVLHIGEQYTKISISEGIEITIQRHAITAILPKGTLKSL